MNFKCVPPFSRRLAVPAISVFLALAVSACCKSSGDSEACPTVYKDLSADQKAGEATCSCDASNATGTVWGSNIYTTDSSVCRAAVHAGVIPASGGAVTVKGAPGCKAYVGTERNGIKTSKWGSFGGSFYFPGKGDGKCVEPVVVTPPGGAVCPGNFKSISGVDANTTITCNCTVELMIGPVWGSDIYTQDSSICKAAVHAGAIPSSGGNVTAKAASGCKKYTGKERNGVKSSNWGSYDTSFFFPSKGNGACL